MSELWIDVPEAQKFCDEVEQNIERYRLFEGENFEKIIQGIAATSSVDTQGESFSLSALKEMAENINTYGLWQCAEHNPLIPPIGRIFAAKVFYSPREKVHFIVIVGGVYSCEKFPNFNDLGFKKEIDDDSDFEYNESEDGHQAKIAFNPHEINKDIIKEILENKPELLEDDPDVYFRKAADPISIFTIISTVWLITANPFSKKFLERCGERAADEVIEYLGWIKNQVITKVSQVSKERILFEFEVPYKGCRVEFVIDSKETDKLIKAVDSVNIAAKASVKLIDQLEKYEIESLVYEFDLGSEVWVPRHAATRKIGVISDKPTLIAIDRYNGFSISGSLGKRSSQD